MITVLCGGVGAARFLRALRLVTDPTDVVAVVNTGDDTVLHGLSISPDLDTITYTLAGAIDPDRGWGLVDETWVAMGALERYANVRPAGSTAAPTWFNLGDRDLATHFYRTARLAEGAPLSIATAEIARAWGVPEQLVPMSDDRVATMIELDDATTVTFQEYFVRLRHSVPVRSVEFAGVADARLHPVAAHAIEQSDAVVIAPSNPIVSIGPVRALTSVDGLLAARRDSVVAVSPIVGGAALKGPADRMLTELGHEASVVGVARLYREVAATLVIDPADAHLAAEVEATGMRALVVPSIMSDPEISARLAASTLAAARR
ncbi:MAG: 2-phospho-L-lactate transferase [Actinobacteria bacterium]|nr:2-phospho-L-lactate transferase [Actinomycetota bacterium]